MRRTRHQDGHDVFQKEDADDSRGDRWMSLQPCASVLALSDLAEATAEISNPEGHATNCKVSELVDKSLEDVFKLTPDELEKVIVERKAERKRNAEEKRLEGLRQIAEMNSRDGIHPVEDLFPEEIWIKILKDNKDLSLMDRYNMRQVHPVFQDLMEGTAIQDTLLPLVMDHKIPLMEWLIQSHHCHYYLNVKPMLILRSVSKSLRDSVDKYIEDYLLNSLQNSGKCKEFHLHTISTYSKDWRKMIRKMNAFSTGMIGQRPMRFISRTLDVDFSPGYFSYEDIDQLLRSFPDGFQNAKAIITELLEKVGDQILFFKLEFDCFRQIDNVMGVPISQVVYELIRDWLLMMPNLKWLDLRIEPRFSGDFRHLPMPKLNALEEVTVFNEISSALEAVLVANPQVKNLTSRFHFDYTHPTVLRVALEGVNTRFQLLRRVIDSNWKIKRMTLRIDDTSLDAVFQHLQQNFPSLEQLSLRISSNVIIGNELHYLRLPNLRHFELEFGSGLDITGDFYYFFALHFLVHCSKLESLTWNNNMDEGDLLRVGFECLARRHSQRLIDFQGEGGVVAMNMRRSNIWDVFPQLGCITVKFPNYRYSINERRGSLSLHSYSGRDANRSRTIAFP